MNLDSRWLALPLSARGLVEELAKIVDSDGALETALVDGADAQAVGDELARLLCAHRNEIGRVRRDVTCLLERGFIALSGSRVELRIEHAGERPSLVEQVPRSTSTVRMRRHRERLETSRRDALSPSHVTPAAVTSDAGDTSPVTHKLSLDQKKFNSNEERGRARDARRLPRDAPFYERAREIAATIGVREPQLVWKAFLARYAETRLDRNWDREWEIYVVREKRWERSTPPNRSTNGPSVKQAVDLDAPWLRVASESS